MLHSRPFIFPSIHKFRRPRRRCPSLPDSFPGRPRSMPLDPDVFCRGVCGAAAPAARSLSPLDRFVATGPHPSASRRLALQLPNDRPNQQGQLEPFDSIPTAERKRPRSIDRRPGPAARRAGGAPATTERASQSHERTHQQAKGGWPRKGSACASVVSSLSRLHVDPVEAGEALVEAKPPLSPCTSPSCLFLPSSPAAGPLSSPAGSLCRLTRRSHREGTVSFSKDLARSGLVDTNHPRTGKGERSRGSPSSSKNPQPLACPRRAR